MTLCRLVSARFAKQHNYNGRLQCKPQQHETGDWNFAKLHPENKVLMLGAMAELGNECLAEHKAIIELIRQYTWGKVILVGGDVLKIEHPFISFSNAAEARTWLQQQYFENTYLLIKGSRSSKMELVLED